MENGRTRDPGEVPLQDMRWRELFNRCDIDGDGYISYAELDTMINSREYERDIPSHVVKMVHNRADKNGDGRIDYEEFKHMITHPDNEVLFGHYMQRMGAMGKTYVNYLVPRRKLGPHSRGTEIDGRTIEQVDGQYEEQYTCCPPPFGMLFISIVEIALFIVDESQGGTRYGDGPVATNLLLDPTRRYQAWRFLTYMFVHIGYMHLIVNLAVQLMLGIPLEMIHRGWRVLLIYFSGVVAGSLGTSVVDPHVKLAGASGGVYALITAHIATIFLNWSQMTMPIVQLLIFVVITVIDTATAIYNRYYLEVNEHIGYMAHFAGAIAGLLVGILILRNLEVTRLEQIIKWFCLALYIILMGTAIIINVALPEYFPKQQYSA